MPNLQSELINANGPAERMEALCDFINFWIGPRNEKYGESAELLSGIELPMPLRKLYEFAGKWPHARGRDFSEWAVGAFSEQDVLRPIEKLKYDAEGRLVFLAENQGVWNCSTKPNGLDPPVYAEGDLWDEEGDIVSSATVCDSLADFLTTFVLQELALGSKQCLFDECLSEMFEAAKNEAIELWINGPFVSGGEYDFWLWRDLLVARLWGSYCFAANHDAGLKYLATKQGRVIKIEIMVGNPWRLGISADGSARIEYSKDQTSKELTLPASTFQFDRILEDLVQRSESPSSEGRTPILFLFRQGQSGSQGQYIPDTDYVTALFRQGIEAASNSGFNKYFEDWPK